MILVYIIIGIIVFMGIRKFVKDVLPVLIVIASVVLGIMILIVTDSMKLALIIGACGIGFYIIGGKLKAWYAERNGEKLWKKLERNYTQMGFVDNSKWDKYLPKFKRKSYPEGISFESITKEFAEKIESEKITNNNEWFHPYLMYCIEKRTGVTLKKMLAEVNCPQLKNTHSTPDEQLLAEQLERSTKKVNRDVPAYLEMVPLSEMPGQPLFVPTKYALKQFGNETDSESKPNQQEFNFDDL